MIHKEILDKLFINNINLWQKDLNKGLDGNSQKIILKHAGIKGVKVNSMNFPYIIDLKSETYPPGREHLSGLKKNFHVYG